MFNYVWPLLLVILSNTFYQICAKEVPNKINPFASLTVTYAIGAVISFIIYCIINKNVNLIEQYKKLNWAPFVLGISIIGLEVGTIYAYKAGWAVNSFSIVSSIILAIILIIVGIFLYKESVSWNKIVGMIICFAGLVFINLK